MIIKNAGSFLQSTHFPFLDLFSGDFGLDPTHLSSQIMSKNVINHFVVSHSLEGAEFKLPKIWDPYPFFMIAASSVMAICLVNGLFLIWQAAIKEQFFSS